MIAGVNVARLITVSALAAVGAIGADGAAPAPHAARQDDPIFQQQGRAGGFVRRMATPKPPAELPWATDRLVGVHPRPTAAQALKDLDSHDFATRERASRTLLGGDVRDEEVFVLLLQPGLSAEQHARLLEAAQKRIVDAPRGALGIQMQERFGEGGGVNVSGVIRGMPSDGLLRTGDRIVEIDGEPIMTSNDLVEIVQNMRPGERVHVVVMRGERDERGRVKADERGRVLENRVEVDVPLGSVSDLERLGDGNLMTRTGSGSRELLVLLLRRDFELPAVPLKVDRIADEPLDVESHPDIIDAHEKLARPSDPALDAGIYGMMQARLSQLEAAARATNLTEAERTWLQAVIARYKQLMTEREPARVRRPR